MTERVLKGVAVATLTGLALIGGWGATELAFWPARQTAERVASEVDQLVALRERVARLRQELSAIAVTGSDRRLDLGGDGGESLQRLQERTRDALVAAHGILTVSEPFTEQLAPGLQVLRVSMRAQLTEPDLLEFLGRIDSALPAIAVTNLEVIPLPSEIPGMLDVSVTLTSVHRDAA